MLNVNCQKKKKNEIQREPFEVELEWNISGVSSDERVTYCAQCAV